MKIQIEKALLGGEITVISSKSYAHRILIAASLGKTPVTVKRLPLCEDVKATIGCLTACGTKISVEENTALVTPQPFSDGVLDCEESGSTLRFMLPVAAAKGINARFEGKGRLPFRPLGAIKEVLKKGGISFDGDTLPFSISGKLKGDGFTVDGSLSSQYVTGLLLALCAESGPKRLNVIGRKVSASYINITLDVLKQFGIEVSSDKDGYSLTVPEILPSPSVLEVEGDWSNAAFFLAAGLISSKITVKGLKYPSMQGDAKIVSLLRSLGGDVKVTENGVVASPSKLKAAALNCSDCPDLIPILVFTACFAEGVTEISGAERLKIKESDRLKGITDILSSAGIKWRYADDVLYVEGGKVSPFVADCLHDHRLIMASSVLASVCGGLLVNADGVEKSYPDYFEAYSLLGGKYALSLQ